MHIERDLHKKGGVLFLKMLAFASSSRLNKCFATFQTGVLLHLKNFKWRIFEFTFDKYKCQDQDLVDQIKQTTYPLVSLHVNYEVLTLPELFWTKTTLKLFQVQVKLFMDLEDLWIIKALAAPFPVTFELSLPRVSDHVTFQGVFVGAPLSAFWTNDFCLIVMLSHFVTQQCWCCIVTRITLVTVNIFDAFM